MSPSACLQNCASSAAVCRVAHQSEMAAPLAVSRGNVLCCSPEPRGSLHRLSRPQGAMCGDFLLFVPVVAGGVAEPGSSWVDVVLQTRWLAAAAQ